MLKRLSNWYIGLLRDTNPVTSYNDYQEGFADVIDVSIATLVFLFMVSLTVGTLMKIGVIALVAAKAFI